MNTLDIIDYIHDNIDCHYIYKLNNKIHPKNRLSLQTSFPLTKFIGFK